MASNPDSVLAAARAFLAEKYPLVEAAYRESVAHDLAAFARAQRAAALEEAADALLGHWKQLPNERTEAVFTSFRRNATDAGIAEARNWLRRRAEGERKG